MDAEIRLADHPPTLIEGPRIAVQRLTPREREKLAFTAIQAADFISDTVDELTAKIWHSSTSRRIPKKG